MQASRQVTDHVSNKRGKAPNDPHVRHMHAVCAHPRHVTHTETTEYKLAPSAAEVLYRLLKMHTVHHTENHSKFLPVLLAMGHTDSRVLGVNCFMSSLKSVKSRDSGFSFRDL